MDQQYEELLKISLNYLNTDYSKTIICILNKLLLYLTKTKKSEIIDKIKENEKNKITVQKYYLRSSLSIKGKESCFKVIQEYWNQKKGIHKDVLITILNICIKYYYDNENAWEILSQSIGKIAPKLRMMIIKWFVKVDILAIPSAYRENYFKVLFKYLSVLRLKKDEFNKLYTQLRNYFMFIKSEPLYETLCNKVKTDFTKINPWKYWSIPANILFLLAQDSVKGCEFFFATVKEFVASEDFYQNNTDIGQYKKRDNPKFQRIGFLFEKIFLIKNTKEYEIIKDFHLLEKCFKLFDKQTFTLLLESYIKIKVRYIHSDLGEFYTFLKEIDKKIPELGLLMDFKNIANCVLYNIKFLNFKLQKENFYNFIEKLSNDDSIFIRFVALIILDTYSALYEFDETNLKFLIKFRNDKSLLIQKAAMGRFVFNETKGERRDKK